MIRIARAALAIAALAVLGACASDGRTLRDPAPTQTTRPAAATTSTTAGGGDGAVIAPAGSLVLASTAFVEGEPLPREITCDGTAPTSPQLSWTGVPAGTVELAITMADPDAQGFVHWAVAGIPTATQGLGAGTVPESAVQLGNDGGTTGWFGPCPPAGQRHRYVFTLYALGRRSGLDATASGNAAVATLTADAIQTATLTGSYQRS